MTFLERADKIRQGLEATYFSVTLTLGRQPYAVVLIKHTDHTMNLLVRETEEYKAIAALIERNNVGGDVRKIIPALRDQGYAVIETSSAPMVALYEHGQIKKGENLCADLLEEIQKEPRPHVLTRFMSVKPQGEPMKKMLEATQGVEPTMKPYTRQFLSDCSTGRSLGSDQEMKLPLTNLTVKVRAPNAEVTVVDENSNPVPFHEIPRSALREIVEFANSPTYYKTRREFQNEIAQEVKAASFFSKEDIEKCVRNTEAHERINKFLLNTEDKDSPKTRQETQNMTFARAYGKPIRPFVRGKWKLSSPATEATLTYREAMGYVSASPIHANRAAGIILAASYESQTPVILDGPHEGCYITPPPPTEGVNEVFLTNAAKCNLLDSVMKGADAIDAAFIAAAGAVATGEMEVPTPMSKYADALDRVFGPNAASLTTTAGMQSQVVFDTPVPPTVVTNTNDDEDCAPTVVIDKK